MDYTSPPHTPQRHSAPQSAQSSPGGLDSTPRSQRHSRSQSSSSDSGRGGLLVSNRLHGPRVMTPDRPTLDGVVGEESWAGRGSARRERRKTVTFDEVLDVQEFEKDSSFERESERSDASSMHSSGSGQGFDGEVDEEYDEEEAMWTREDELADREDAQRNDRLVVVNGSPYNSTPSSMDESDRFEPDEHEGGSETDSRDISSSDEPASPPQGPTMQLPIDDVSFDKSFDKSYATALNTSFDASFEEAGGLSFASLGAADRVDDMVDQLLREDILSSPTPQAGPTMGLSQPHRKSASPSTPIDALVGESPSGSHVQQADSPAHVTVDGEMEDPFTTPETLANTATHLPMQRPSPARSMQASIHSKMGSDECDHARNLQDGPEDEGSPSASRRPLPHLPPADEEGPSTSNTLAPPREGQHGDGLPTLPNWSPLVFDEAPLPDENEHDGAAQAASHHQSATRDVKLDEFGSASPNAKTGSVSGARRTPSARGRPHISRDAVLERVAREKRLANAGAQNGGQSSSAAGEQGMNASHTHSEIMSNHGTRGRASESAVAMAKSASEGVNASTSHAVPRPSMPARANTGGNRVEARAAAQPSPLKQTFENLESPLDRLGAEVAKRGSMDSGEGERRDGWFDRSRETSVEPSAPGPEPASASKLSPSSVSAALPANNTLRPPSSADQDAGPSSGRLSPSTLGAPPPPVSPAQRELQIIARRRSKNGRSGPGMRKRSLSTGDANPPLRRASAGSGGPGAEGGSAEEGDSPVDEEEEEEEEGPAARKNVEADLASSKLLLDLSVQKALESGFGHGVEREISRIYKEGEVSLSLSFFFLLTCQLGAEKSDHIDAFPFCMPAAQIQGHGPRHVHGCR